MRSDLARKAFRLGYHYTFLVLLMEVMLLVVKCPEMTWLAMLVLLGLFLAFYLQSAALLAWEEENGSWRIVGECRKGGALFEERLAECITPERRKPE